jgi:hypothetical protein
MSERRRMRVPLGEIREAAMIRTRSVGALQALQGSPIAKVSAASSTITS